MWAPKRVALVVGASRGIGRQIAIDLAKNGYSGAQAVFHANMSRVSNNSEVVVSAKSTSDVSQVSPFPPDPNSPQSTISTVEREILEAGYEATSIPVDTRDFASVERLVDRTIEVGRALSDGSPGPASTATD
jgi:NAD(P)-dependent dehydrogenase (short-subunit alcohol dehydrogenase family)